MTSPSRRSAVGLIMLVFFLQPLALGAWLPRIPDIQAALHLQPAELAFALLGISCGTAITLPFASRVVGRLGSRRTLFFFFIAFLATMPVPAFTGNAPLLFVTLLVVGMAMSVLELGMNIEADQIEKAAGRAIMNRCHGLWSAGIMSGNFLGTVLGSLQVPPHLAVLGVSVTTLPLALMVTFRLPDTPTPGTGPEKTATPHENGKFTLPSGALLGICLATFGIGMTEGAMADWSAIFMRTELGGNEFVSGLAYTVFALLMTGGRMMGDVMKTRLGPVTTARICATSALIGVLVVVNAPVVPLALAGFAAVGFGVSVGFPLAVTASASLPTGKPAQNVATLSFVALFGFLVGPPVIGFATQLAGLRLGLAMLLPALLLCLILTRFLAPKVR